MDTPPLIEARGLSRTFVSSKKEEGVGGFMRMLLHPTKVKVEALKSATFTVQPGEFVGLIGANGAGKTTLLKILSGLIPPTTGSASVMGFDPFKRNIAFRRRIALVMGQKAQLWWDLAAVDAFKLLEAIYDIPPALYKERLQMLSELLGVQSLLGTQIRRLSLGERMKMELIGALLHWPDVVFLDEPTIGLDVLAAHRLREFLRSHNHEQKATILLTSHNMEDIARLCPRILILREGELIYDGPPSQLTRQGEQRLRVRLMESPSFQDLAALTGLPLSVIHASPPAVEVEDSGPPSVYFSLQADQIVPTVQTLLSRHRIVDMGIEEQSLERVIQNLYEERT